MPTRTIRCAFAIAGTIALTGCLVIPTPELSEIRPSRLEFIEPGVTTSAELEAQLLSDDLFLARITGPYTIYAEQRRAPFSIVSDRSTELMGDVDDYLVVEYDDDRVVRFDRVMREGGCTDFGICVRGGDEYAPRSLIVYGPADRDDELKRFESHGGTCSVYAYIDGAPVCNGKDVQVGANYPGNTVNTLPRVRVDGYLHWDAPAATGISASGTLRAWRRGEMLADYAFDCSDGEIVIVALELASCLIGTPEATFTPRPLSEGKEEVLDRRLMPQ